jgi:hypothetical protein
VIGNSILNAEPAKPAIGEIERDLLAQAPLGADAVAIADEKHPDHQLWINRRAADVRVVRRELRSQIG